VRRHGTAGRKPAKKPQQREPTKPRNTPTAARRQSPSAGDLQEQLDQRTRERDVAQKQQEATSHVLRVISTSRGDLQPVFEAILTNATHICEAEFGTLWLTEGEALRVVLLHNVPPAFAEERRRNPVIYPRKGSILNRVVQTKQVVHITDVTTNSRYTVAMASLTGARTVLLVPMINETKLVGVIVIYRLEVRPFTEKQVELVNNFAAQAVIAIENARLLNELRESLQQQTATAEVLSVISSTPGELTPVFETMLVNAGRLCEAKFGNLLLYEGGRLRTVATHNVPPAYAESRRRRGPFHPSPGLAEVIRTKQTIQIPDLAATQAYAERHPVAVEAVELGGVRTLGRVDI
jgi:hypothetical protein